MLYREITKDKVKVSQLGFGCMRFPVLEKDNARIDEEKAIEMVRYAIDHGVNYIDTAYNYHGGNSEDLVKKALADGYREKVVIADKLPVWLTDTYEDFEAKLDEQLERLGTDTIDFYLLHSLYRKTWDKIKELDVFSFLDEAKKKGKIKYAGFSFHDEYPVFEEILNSYDWDFCQIQLNYLDTEYQAGLKGLQAAYDKGISVVIMEPLKGGKLSYVPKDIQEVFANAETKQTPSAWAFSYLWDRPEVSVVLSGMSTMEQVKENIETASRAGVGHFSQVEKDRIEEAKTIYKARVQVGCTSCEYCMPCPVGVNIPGNFELFNNAFVYELKEENQERYKKFQEEKKDASQCVECGNCEKICPQHLPVIEDLKRADAFLSE